MAILPPAVILTLVLDGRRLPSYLPVYFERGRVVGPIEPFVTRVAQSVAYRNGYMILVRADRRVRIALAPRDLGQLSQTYVSLGPVLRALGERVELDRGRGLVLVRSSSRFAVRSPEPFSPGAPEVSPYPVFTPEPISTPRPVWTGSPRPRRTPIPAASWATPRPKGGRYD